MSILHKCHYNKQINNNNTIMLKCYTSQTCECNNSQML